MSEETVRADMPNISSGESAPLQNPDAIAELCFCSKEELGFCLLESFKFPQILEIVSKQLQYFKKMIHKC